MVKNRLLWFFAALGLIFVLVGAARGGPGRYAVVMGTTSAAGAWVVRVDTSTGEAWKARLKVGERSRWKGIRAEKVAKRK